ncbi:MAG: hypothetical protein V3V96_15445 [Acidiferrobacterales bacterium]
MTPISDKLPLGIKTVYILCLELAELEKAGAHHRVAQVRATIEREARHNRSQFRCIEPGARRKPPPVELV